MAMLLVALLMIAIAYLLAHFVVDRLQRRYLFVSGVEYILLGVGLSFFKIFQHSESFMPAIAFALGWVGILYGLTGDLRKQRQEENGYDLRLAVMETLVVGIGVGALGSFFFQMISSNSSDALACGAMLGCSAAAGSSSAVKVISGRYPNIKTALLPTLKGSAQISSIISIAAFGFLICIHHAESSSVSAATWSWITLILGGGLGILYAAFLVADSSENSRFLALTGIICFASGAAFFLNLSVLAVTLFLGLVIANTRHGQTVLDTMASAQKPALLILLVFAGVLWKPVGLLPGIGITLGYWSLRTVLKAIGGWLATKGTVLRGDIFRGHLAQGEVALAIALSFRLIFDSPAADLAYTAVIISVAINELIAPRFLRGLLVDAGDIRQDISESRGA